MPRTPKTGSKTLQRTHRRTDRGKKKTKAKSPQTLKGRTSMEQRVITKEIKQAKELMAKHLKRGKEIPVMETKLQDLNVKIGQENEKSDIYNEKLKSENLLRAFPGIMQIGDLMKAEGEYKSKQAEHEAKAKQYQNKSEELSAKIEQAREAEKSYEANLKKVSTEIVKLEKGLSEAKGPEEVNKKSMLLENAKAKLHPDATEKLIELNDEIGRLRNDIKNELNTSTMLLKLRTKTIEAKGQEILIKKEQIKHLEGQDKTNAANELKELQASKRALEIHKELNLKVSYANTEFDTYLNPNEEHPEATQDAAEDIKTMIKESYQNEIVTLAKELDDLAKNHPNNEEIINAKRELEPKVKSLIKKDVKVKDILDKENALQELKAIYEKELKANDTKFWISFASSLLIIGIPFAIYYYLKGDSLALTQNIFLTEQETKIENLRNPKAK